MSDPAGLSLAELYDLKEQIRAQRNLYGQGRTPEAQHVREWAKAYLAEVNKELRARREPLRAADDGRRYGPDGR